MGNKLGAFLAKPAKYFLNRFDFVKFAANIAQYEPGASHIKRADIATEAAFENQDEISRLAVDLAEKALAEKGDPVGRQELEAQADTISCRYDSDLHLMLRAAFHNLGSHIFESKDPNHLFVSGDQRELKHLQRLKEAQQNGAGVVYLINHTSHLDELILNAFFDQNGLPMPLFAAGQNMMVTPSLARIFMIGSYVILRAGSSRAYLSTLFHYCQSLAEFGKSQSIFLEAWSGGARTRDGSLRYPKRLIALQGALAAKNDVFIQPVVISYSRVPEDLGMSEGRGLASWLNGNHMPEELLKRPWDPKKSLVKGLKNIYGRTYVGLGQGALVSELAAEQAALNGNSELTIDEYASLYAIREIARDKKIMTSQVAARALGLYGKYSNLTEAAARAVEEINTYHRRTFNQDPDFEDYFSEHSLVEALNDGLKSLQDRKVIGPRPLFLKRPPVVLSTHGLSYYATHGDRRLYSPSAKENFVVCGVGSWAFSLVSYLGRRTLVDKKYNNSSLTIYDKDEQAISLLVDERTIPHEFPEHRLPKNVFPTHDHTAAFRKATEVVVAVPPRNVDEVLKVVFAEAKELRSLIIASRGFDPQSHRLTMQIAWEAAVSAGRSNINILALSGPFTPTSLVEETGGLWTLAGQVSSGRASEALLFKYGKFRVHMSTDIIGVQMAAALADVYALYWVFVSRQRKIRNNSAESAAFLREVSAEAKSLTLAIGGQSQTFEADNPAWVTEFLISFMSSSGPSQSWLTNLKNATNNNEELTRDNLIDQWPDPWATGFLSTHSAYITAKHLGLSLPHLEEANRMFWGE